jgi:hypothetical protein
VISKVSKEYAASFFRYRIKVASLLKMELCSCETLISTYQPIWGHNPEDHNKIIIAVTKTERLKKRENKIKQAG